jgi:hypothetical protein
MDAIVPQKKIAQQIVDAKGNYILALKANHESTHIAAFNYVEEHLNNDFSGMLHQQLDESPSKRVHGRKESPISMDFEVPLDFPNRSQWAGLR